MKSVSRILELVKGYEQELRVMHQDVNIFKTEYLSIAEDGRIKISPYSDYLKDSQIGVVFYHFSYTVITAWDFSCFVQFVDDVGYCDDHYLMNGWTIGIVRPYTANFRTYNMRSCTIGNGEFSIEVTLPVNDIAEKMKMLWPYYLKAQECKTQKELNLLKDCYEKDIKINELTKDNLCAEHERMAKEEQLKAYKAVLDKIEELIAP